MQRRMAPRQPVDVGIVAATDDADERTAGAPDGADHPRVAFGKAEVGQGEAAEAVVRVGIDAGIVEHDVGA